MELFWQIALTQVEGVGSVLAKNLISHCGSASEVFKAKKHQLLKIPVIGEYTANSIIAFKEHKRIEQELSFIEKHKIKTHFYADKRYPYRLKSNSDCPIILYQLGDTDLNMDKVIGIVGTRTPTEYGTTFCERLIKELEGSNMLIMSGMAFGIDICAHREAIKYKLPTVGVLAHGLDRIYPSGHKKYIRPMLEQEGGLITEFISETVPDRENFPKRNRIVAGLCDAIIVVETAKRGGSMITAELAWQYDRNLLALPGRGTDTFSAGCNYLIKTNRAEMIETVDDLMHSMSWDKSSKPKPAQRELPLNLPEQELKLLNLLKQKEQYEIDALISDSGMSSSKVALSLLDLEFKGYVKSLPGKRYQLI